MIVGLVISVLISILLAVYCYTLKRNNIQVVKLNTKQQEENQRLADKCVQLNIKRENLKDNIEAQEKALQSLSQTRAKLEEDAEILAQKFYNSKVEELMKEAKTLNEALAADYERQKSDLNKKIVIESQKLKDLEDKQLAYIQAKQRQEEIDSNKDYYRLAIDNVACDDIALLRETQKRLSKKEAIDKVIYEGYYKAAYDILMSHLFTSSQKICGIYKITDLITGQAYIGQSVDIKERFKQHIKSSLAYSGATNKLYQTMQKSGQQNFTFEILEEVPRGKLNEREAYWINFYKTRDFGLNSTRGNS